MFGTVDIGIISPVFRKLKNFFKNIFIGLKHLELRKRNIVDVIPHAGYYEFKKDSDANDMTVQQYYRCRINKRGGAICLTLKGGGWLSWN